jgi:hypothetical protein
MVGRDARLTPSQIGARAEFAVAAALTAAGKEVYLPMFGAHSRVDLAFQDEGGFWRVQCKSSRIVNMVLMFRTCSNTNRTHKDYRGQIDFFGVYSPHLDRVFLVPVDDVPIREGFLRLEPARNGQQKRLRWARDYVLGPPLGETTAVLRMPLTDPP